MSLNKGSLDKAIRELKIEKIKDSSNVTIIDLDNRDTLIDIQKLDINSAELSGATLERGAEYSYLLLDALNDFIRIPFVVSSNGVYRIVFWGCKVAGDNSSLYLYMYNQQTSAELSASAWTLISTDILYKETAAGYDVSLSIDGSYIVKFVRDVNGSKIHGVGIKRIS